MGGLGRSVGRFFSSPLGVVANPTLALGSGAPSLGGNGMPGSALTGGGGGGKKNQRPPNFLEGPAQAGVGAAMPGLTAGLASGASFDPTQNINNAITANYNQATSRLDPQWQQRQQAFASTMANQGLDPGTQAYDASAGTLNRARNDAYTSAMNNAIAQGNQTALVGMQGAMLPFNQFSTLMHGAQPGAQQGLDVYNAGQMQQQGKKNAAGSIAPFLMGGGGAGAGAGAGAGYYTGALPMLVP